MGLIKGVICSLVELGVHGLEVEIILKFEDGGLGI